MMLLCMLSLMVMLALWLLLWLWVQLLLVACLLLTGVRSLCWPSKLFRCSYCLPALLSSVVVFWPSPPLSCSDCTPVSLTCEAALWLPGLSIGRHLVPSGIMHFLCLQRMPPCPLHLTIKSQTLIPLLQVLPHVCSLLALAIQLSVCPSMCVCSYP